MKSITENSIITEVLILRYQLKDSEIAQYIIDLILNLDAHCNGDKGIRSQIESMLLYRQLSKCIHNNYEKFRIYENVTECETIKYRPLFWLQMAIAFTADKQYPEALSKFDTAYALAKNIGGYNTYQIDTHYAHFLLQRALDLGISEDDNPYDVFEQAHQSLMNRPRGDESRYYIYRVAQDYMPFYLKFKARMSATEIVKFKNHCRNMNKMATSYLEKGFKNERALVSKVVTSLSTIADE